jgi:hypothetical protein
MKYHPWIAIATLFCGTAAITSVLILRAFRKEIPPFVATQSSQAAAVAAPHKRKDVSELPNILPGDSCDKVRALYGKETEAEKYAKTWKRDNIQVWMQVDKRCIATTVMYFIQRGHTASTLDGVILGRDTVADATQKLLPRLSGNTASIWQGEGQVHAALELPPSLDLPFKSSYDWALPENIIGRLKREPALSDFTSEAVYSYSIEISSTTHSEVNIQ